MFCLTCRGVQIIFYKKKCYVLPFPPSNLLDAEHWSSMRHPSLSSSSTCSLDLPPETIIIKIFQQNNNDEQLLPENQLL